MFDSIRALLPSLMDPIDASDLNEHEVVQESLLKQVDQMFMSEMAVRLNEWQMPDGLLTGKDPNNRWRTGSTMQKAIRHGDVEMAMNAAHGLYGMDPSYLYKRLGVCAAEDVAMGNPIAVAMTLAALGSKAWRTKVGDQKLGVWLAKELASGIKDRNATNLCLMADYAPHLEWARNQWGKLPDSELWDMAAAKDQPLDWRMLAAWMMAGTKRYYNRNVPASNDRPRWGLMRLMQSSGMPLICYYIADRVAARLNECMFIGWYLMSELALKAEVEGCQVVSNDLPEIKRLGPLTGAGYDMHTREGKTAIMKCAREIPAIKEAVAHIEDIDLRKFALGEAVFQVEGGMLDRVWSFPAYDQIDKEGNFRALERPGIVTQEAQDHLMGLFRDNLDHLNECRRKVLWASFYSKK